jgi:hypothetical protein
VLEEGTEDDLLLDVLAREIFPGACPPLHLRLRPQQPPVYQRLDFGLGHRRSDPCRLGVRDASRLHRHLTAKVQAGSNVAQGFDMHTLEEHDAERRRYRESSQRWKWARRCGSTAVARSL